MFAFPNVFHFFAHKLSRLSGRRFPFTFVLARTFDCFFFWHNKIVSPLATRLDVTKRRNICATKAVALREEAMMILIRASLLTEICRSIQSQQRRAERQIEQMELESIRAAARAFDDTRAQD